LPLSDWRDEGRVYAEVKFEVIKIVSDEILASIIVPVYNAEPYLRECLDSVLMHVPEKYSVEVIAVDDGSTDSSCEILKEYGKRYGLIWTAQRNGGPGGARNTGMLAASGRYLLFLDSDDYFIPGRLEGLLAMLEAADSDIVEFEYDILNESGRDFKARRIDPSPTCGPGQDIFCAWKRSGFFRSMVWTKAVSREMIVSNGLYFRSGIHYEDEEWCNKVFAYARNVAYMPLCCYMYRLREGSETSCKTPRHYADLVKIIDSLDDFVKTARLSQGYVKAIRQTLAFFYFSAVKGVKINGKYDEALVEALYERRHIMKYSDQPHKKYFYRHMINIFGVKAFCKVKYDK
jgi:glycosyltransferase involved in cell wall biosynthesis